MRFTPSENLMQDFHRDFVIGDKGKDVAKLQEILSFLGYLPDSDEVARQTFGKSTLAAAERLRRDAAENPIVSFLAGLVLQFVFGSDPEEAAPELRRGQSKPIRRYASDDMPRLQALEAGFRSSCGMPAAAELASRYIGQREIGDNRGAVVRYFNGSEGLPWCGGFVHTIMSKSISPELFAQSDFLRARSFEDEASKHGAFRKASSSYAPHVGDVVVFNRGGGNGHVGIVSEVGLDGTVTYIAGNDGNAVRARSFDAKKPPQSLIGYADTQALAQAKGIALAAPSLAFKDSGVRLGAVTRHSDAAFARG